METEGTSADGVAPAEFDRVTDALGHEERRQVLVSLLEHDPLDYRAAVAGDVATDRDAVHTRLVHMHLPKLEEMGFVSWDRDAETVARGYQWEQIEPMLRLLADHEERLLGTLI